MDEQVRINVLTSKIYKDMSLKGSKFNGILTYDMCKSIAEKGLGTKIEEQPEFIIYSEFMKEALGDSYEEFLIVAKDKLSLDDTEHDDCNIPVSEDDILKIRERLNKIYRNIDLKKIEEEERKKRDLEAKKRYEQLRHERWAREEEESERQRLEKEARELKEREAMYARAIKDKEMENEVASRKFFRLIEDRKFDEDLLKKYIPLRYCYLTGDNPGGYGKKVEETLTDMSLKLYWTSKFLKKHGVITFGTIIVSKEYENRLSQFIEDVKSGLALREPIGNFKNEKDKSGYFEENYGRIELRKGIPYVTDHMIWKDTSINTPDIVSASELDIYDRVPIPNKKDIQGRYTKCDLANSETLNIAVAFFENYYDVERLSELIGEIEQRNIIANIVMSVIEADVLICGQENNKNLIEFARSLNAEGYEDNPIWNTESFPDNTNGAFRLRGFHPNGERIAICDFKTLEKRIKAFFGKEKKAVEVKNDLDRIVKSNSEINIFTGADTGIDISDSSIDYWREKLLDSTIEGKPTLNYEIKRTDEYLNILNRGIFQCNLSVYNAEFSKNKCKEIKTPGIVTIMRCTPEDAGNRSDELIKTLTFLYKHNNRISVVTDLNKADILLVMPNSRCNSIELVRRAIEMNKNISDKWDKLPNNRIDPLTHNMLHPDGEKVFICTPETLFIRLAMLYGYNRNAPTDYEIKKFDLNAPEMYKETKDNKSILDSITLQNKETISNNENELHKLADDDIKKSRNFFKHLDISWDDRNDILVQRIQGTHESEITNIKLILGKYGGRYWSPEKLRQFYKLYTYGIAGTVQYKDMIDTVVRNSTVKVGKSYEEFKERIFSGNDERTAISKISISNTPIRIMFADQIYRSFIDKKEPILKNQLKKLVEERMGHTDLSVEFTSNIKLADALIINRQSPLNDLYLMERAMSKTPSDVYKSELNFDTMVYKKRVYARFNANGEKIFVCTLEGFLNRLEYLLNSEKKLYKVNGYSISDKNAEIIKSYRDKYFSDWDNLSHEDRVESVVILLRYRGDNIE